MRRDQGVLREQSCPAIWGNFPKRDRADANRSKGSGQDGLAFTVEPALWEDIMAVIPFGIAASIATDSEIVLRHPRAEGRRF